MATPRRLSYDQVLENARQLPADARERLVAALNEQNDGPFEPEGSLNLTDLIGLGKEIWRDPETGDLFDAQEYVNRERDS